MYGTCMQNYSFLYISFGFLGAAVAAGLLDGHNWLELARALTAGQRIRLAVLLPDKNQVLIARPNFELEIDGDPPLSAFSADDFLGEFDVFLSRPVEFHVLVFEGHFVLPAEGGGAVAEVLEVDAVGFFEKLDQLDVLRVRMRNRLPFRIFVPQIDPGKL